jgi:hypothetical protein
VKFEVDGLKELDAALAQLPGVFRREVVLKAWRKASQPILLEARSRARRQAAPARRGGQRIGSPMSSKWGLGRALAESMTVSPVKADNRFADETAVKLGPDAGHYYGLFVEKGTRAHGTRAARSRAIVWRISAKTGQRKLGVRRGLRAKKGHAATRPFQFLQPAFALHGERAIPEFGVELWKEIEAKARNLARAAGRGKLSDRAREGLLE